MSEKKLNLPAVRNTGLKKSPKKRAQSLNLERSSTLSDILSSDKTAREDIAQSEQGLDLVLVGDLTTSMTTYHELLKREFSKLCNDLFPLIRNLRIGVIFYLDHDGHLPYLTRVCPLTKNVHELHNFIRETPVLHDGNSTDDEAVEDAINDLVNKIKWREIGGRSAVLFGDARAHEPDECPHQHSYFDLTRQMYDKNIIVNSVYCGDNYSADSLQKLENVDVGDFSRRVSNLGHPNFFSWIANVTGGMIIGVDQINDLLEIIKVAAAKDSGNLDKHKESLKLSAPKKLNLIDVAERAEKRRKLSQNKRDLLSDKSSS